MKVCVECGFRNEADEMFCGGCGAYLEWAEEEATADGGDGVVADVADVADGIAAEPGTAAAEEVTVGAVAVGAVADEAVAEDPTAAAGADEPAAAVRNRGAEESRAGVAADAAERDSADQADSVPGEEQPAAAGAGAALPPHSDVSPAAAAERSSDRSSDRGPNPGTEPAVSTGSRAAASAGEGGGLAGLSWRLRRGTAAVAGGGVGQIVTAPATAARQMAQAPATAARSASQAPATAARSATQAATSATAPVHPGAAARRAAAPGLVAPVRPTAPKAGRVAPVKPGAARPTPPPREAKRDEPPPNPGDLICGSCGAGNTPTRKFCRRCGTSLQDAKIQPRRSWLSRLFRPEPKAGPAAGTRRPVRQRRFPTGLVVTLLVIGALVFVGFLFRPELGRAAVAVQDRIQGNSAFNPVAVTASSAAEGFPADQARDGTTNLSWQPAVTGDGVGEYLDFTFAEPFRLTRLLVIPGASDVEADFLAGASPSLLEVTLTSATGVQEVVEMPLEDAVGLQNMAMEMDDVVGVRVQIAGAYRATEETRVAIAEVEFRGRAG